MQKSILIIEDEKSIQNILKAFLEDAGYDIALASDGMAGIAAFHKAAYDLILLDIMMPKLHLPVVFFGCSQSGSKKIKGGTTTNHAKESYDQEKRGDGKVSLWKRAYLYSVRKKGKTITLLAFLLVMATMMLTCLSIQTATETANANIKKALLGYFTINAKRLESGISEDTVSQILAVDGLSGRHTLRSIPMRFIMTQTGNLWKSALRARLRCRRGMRTPARS